MILHIFHYHKYQYKGYFGVLADFIIDRIDGMNVLYEALTKAGVDEETAKNAAKAVLDTEILATKKDLAELKTEII